MAVNTFTGATDNNWGTATNWSLGSVPTSSDGHTATFDVTSPNCTVNASSRVCNNIDFTNYTNTITMSNQITVSGNITLGASMGISGSGVLVAGAACTYTSNGKTWPNELQSTSTGALTTVGATTVASFNKTAGVNGILTLGADFTCQGNWTSADTITINGTYNVNIGGNFDHRAIIGSNPTIILNGTGNWTTIGGTVSPKIQFNTSGTITMTTTSANYLLTNNVTYTAGTIVTVGTTVSITGSTGTWNTSGMTWWNFSRPAGVNPSITLASDLYVANNFSSVDTTTITGSTYNIYVGGSFSNTALLTGTGTGAIILNGTGTWSGNGNMDKNLTINTDSVITISGSVNLRGGTFNYIKGKVISSGSTINVTSSSTMNGCNKINLATITVTAGQTLTMDYFFNGSPSNWTTLQSSSVGSVFTLTFSTAREQLGRYVTAKYCSLSQRGRVLIITARGNGGGNTGIRYVNQTPNLFGTGNNNIPLGNFAPAMGWVKQY